MKNQEQNQKKRLKRIGIVCLILGITLIIVVASVLLFQSKKEKQESSTTPKAKEFKQISESIEVSKSSAYQQSAFLSLYDLPEETKVFSTGSYRLEELGLNEKYKSCTGTLNFQGETFKKWNFQTNCEGDNDNMSSAFLSISNQDIEIANLKKAGEGYVLLTESKSAADIGITYLDNNYNVVWEKHLTDSTKEDAHIFAAVSMETPGGFYVLGYAEKVAGGDFQQHLEAGDTFSFLAKFDLTGNQTSFINLTALNSKIARVTTLSKSVGNKLYMATSNQVLTLTDEKKLDIVGNINIDGYPEEITESAYLFSRDYETTIKQGKIISNELVLLNKDGSVKWTLPVDKIEECKETYCMFNQFKSISDFYVATIENKIYMIDSNGKVVKKIDYTDIAYEDQVIEQRWIATVVPEENSYMIITYPTGDSIHMERYDFKHKLIDEKTYKGTPFVTFDENSDTMNFSYKDNKLTIDFVLLGTIPTIGKIELQ